MKQDEKNVFIKEYGARAIAIREALAWEDPSLNEVADRPAIDDELYAHSHGMYRRGVVVEVFRTRVTVLLTTEGAVSESLRYSRAPHYTFATRPIKDLRTK